MTYKQIAIAIIGIIAFLFVMGLAGRADYYEQISSNMSQKTYNEISKKINSTDGNDVAKYYLDHEKECESNSNR